LQKAYEKQQKFVTFFHIQVVCAPQPNRDCQGVVVISKKFRLLTCKFPTSGAICVSWLSNCHTMDELYPQNDYAHPRNRGKTIVPASLPGLGG
jgi:hypothetical protein